MHTQKLLPSLLAAFALTGLLATAQTSLADDAATTAAPDARAAPSVVTPPAPPSPSAASKPGHKLKITITADAKLDDGKPGSVAGKGADGDAAEDSDGDDSADHGGRAHGKDDALVGFGHDSTLAAGKHASTVVSVLGSSTSDGEVEEAVVSVLGDTRVTGKVGENAVAVFGSTYVDGHVGEDVVAVLGNVELGPHADVGGDVVAIGGELIRDPAAIVHGTVQNVALFGKMSGFGWLHPWVHHCLMLGRPLAFVPGIGWAWTLALGFLGLYLLIALLFPQGIVECARTMEERPGRAVLASLFTFILKPIVFLVLVVTVIGAALIPFLAFALFVAGLFGKAVALAWLGRRVVPARADGAERPPVLAVLVGGLIALLLYVVPFFGFIAYKLFDILGLGIVVYTLILRLRSNRAAKAPPPAAAATPTAQAAAASPAAAAATPEPLAGAAAGATPPPAAPPAAPPPAPAPVSLEIENRAGFWIRMAALLLDLVLVGVVLSMVHIGHDSMLVFLAAYGAVMWKLRGTTIGGIICGLRVARLDGRAMDWPTAIARALGAFLSLVVAGLGFIWVVFDADRQSWHDKIAGTVVVHVPRGTPLV